jgi:hypothetical protein
MLFGLEVGFLRSNVYKGIQYCENEEWNAKYLGERVVFFRRFT